MKSDFHSPAFRSASPHSLCLRSAAVHFLLPPRRSLPGYLSLCCSRTHPQDRSQNHIPHRRLLYLPLHSTDSFEDRFPAQQPARSALYKSLFPFRSPPRSSPRRKALHRRISSRGQTRIIRKLIYQYYRPILQRLRPASGRLRTGFLHILMKLSLCSAQMSQKSSEYSAGRRKSSPL